MKNIPLKDFILIVYFLLLVFIGDRSFEYLLTTQIINKSEFRYSKLYTGRAKADILLIGNSRGLSFYQPIIEELTKKSTFNLSYNGLPTDLAKVLFTDYLKNNASPELVIIEATIKGTRPELVSNFSCYSMHSTELNNLVKSNQTGFLYDLFHLTKFNGEVFQRVMYFLNKSDLSWLNERVISKKMLNIQLNEEQLISEFDIKAAKDIKHMIKLCVKNKIKYRLIINPYLPAYLDKMKNIETQKTQLSDYLNEEIFDYSKSIKNPALFSDYLHVNKSGGKELMRLLYKDGIFSAGETY